MRFAKEHLFGLILGIVLYEVYYRSQAKPGGGG
jgi:hypothetical protein